MKKNRLSILGSTGSIGVQTLDIVRENPDGFEVVSLTAHRNWQKLAEQAIAFDVDTVVIGDEQYYKPLCEALSKYPIKVFAGDDSIASVASAGNCDTVVNALVGYAGLIPTARAIEAHKRIALANKETLVVGGATIMPMAIANKAPILPIDSEHSAIFQCLIGEHSPLRRLIITCSGGALRNVPKEKLADITAEQALRHPRWDMGAKITIDSATLVNKGFEVIEAHWLFGTPAEKIDVVIHPESIIHSMVEFEDGSIKAQMGEPDMRAPISIALMYPERAVRDVSPFDFVKNSSLTFREVDNERFPALGIAYDCLRRGGSSAATMNGANEVAVAAFLAGKCGYLDIVGAIEFALAKAQYVATPSLTEYAEIDAESRALAREYLKL
ncbi:MAG: 1-deoxy-D-xylulose-5-phosphate reductoisomerase [Alistipes sp.]|nr:1-deoxy-D-xylulose-5-phosphate reductoisomerase [Alistipes sp.]